jgi:hypothetical protein
VELLKSTREKIIVGLMAVAVLYFVYDYFPASGPALKNAVNSHDAALVVVAELQEKLEQGAFDLPEPVTASLAGLHAPWDAGKFVPAVFRLSEQRRLSGDEPARRVEFMATAGTLVYSGFLEMDGRRLAVINGSEYAVGDMVNDLRLDSIGAQALKLSLGEHSLLLPIVDLDAEANRQSDTR